MEITTTGIGLAKSAFQVHGVDRYGKVVLRKTESGQDAGVFYPAATVFDRHGST